MLLHEEYRPRKLSEVIGQDKAVKKIEAISRRGFTGKSFWITGKSGTGKTTIARIIARGSAAEYAITEIDAQDVTLSLIRDWEKRIRSKPIGSDAHVLIVNEAHQLRSDAVSRLLTVLESTGFMNNAVLIFTTTIEGDVLFNENFDAGPFASRTIQIPLASRGTNKLFAERAREIAEAEGLGGKPAESFQRLANDCRGNFRAILGSIEAGEMIA